MTSADSTTTPELLRVFFEAGRNVIQRLATEPGFHAEEVLEASSPSGLRIVTPEEAAGWFFWARIRFQTSRIIGELTYGDQEFFVNMVIGRTGSAGSDQERYGLWEWAAALGVPDAGAGGGTFASTTARVQSLVAGIGHALTVMWPRIGVAGSDAIEFMDTARLQMRNAYAEAEAHRKHEHISAEAAEAFRVHDFRRVIGLLEPISGRLSMAERMKLQLARKYAEGVRRTT